MSMDGLISGTPYYKVAITTSPEYSLASGNSPSLSSNSLIYPLPEDHDFELGSFQRSSIRLQRDYAFIIVCGAIISKLSDAPPTMTPPTMTANVCNVMDATLERSVKILGFIADDNDYKWYLQWAPTYSALFPAFTSMSSFLPSLATFSQY